MSSLKNLHVILVRAENPMNIGHVARAMKNFAVSKLVLVNCANHKNSEAYTTGWKAKSILDRAKCFQNLDDVLQKSAFSVGFTTRRRVHRGSLISFAKIVPQILDILRDQKVHLVFGNEKHGLSNDELSECHVVVTLPAHPAYSSLNLSHAVAIALFGIFSQTQEARFSLKNQKQFYATSGDYKDLEKDFSKVLKLLDYKNSPKRDLFDDVQRQLKNFFWKAGLEKRELNLFRAFLYRIHQRLKD
jgi:tRNA/rRNA methyltransferase